MKKITRRAFALLMAVLMVTGLALNVSAASFYDFKTVGGYNCYASSRFTDHWFTANTSTENPDALVKTVALVYEVMGAGEYDYYEGYTSTPARGSSTVSYTLPIVISGVCSRHLVDNISFYEVSLGDCSFVWPPYE